MKKWTAKNTIMRILCMLLVCSMVGVMVSCASPDTTENPDQTVTEPDTETDTDTDPETPPEIELVPDVPVTDMNQKNIHIFLQQWGTYMPLAITDVFSEGLTSDGINDAAYRRNMEMEEKFNCTITITENLEYGFNGYNEVMRTVSAGDDVYTLTLFRVQQYNTLCLSNSFFEISDIPHIDLSKPWWDSGYAEAAGVVGRQYGVVSDITMNSYLLTGSVYFNKDMINDYSLESPYKLVHEGEWTWDTMFTMAETAAEDLNGDEEYTNEDRYGITYINDSPEVLLAAAGVTFAELDKDGIPQVTLDSTLNMDKIMYLFELLQDTTVSYNCHKRSAKPAEDEAGMLLRGNTLFCLGGLYYAPEMRAMDQDFGIIPYPKYDEAQEDYLIPSIPIALSYASVPTSNTDMENTGIFMEYYAYLGRRDIMPELYEKLLLGRVARDEESAAMLDIIFNNRIFDTGMIFDFGGLRTNLQTMYRDMNGNFASSFAGNASKVQSNIDELVELFYALEN